MEALQLPGHCGERGGHQEDAGEDHQAQRERGVFCSPPEREKSKN